jgi:hypothetical protein
MPEVAVMYSTVGRVVWQLGSVVFVHSVTCLKQL